MRDAGVWKSPQSAAYWTYHVGRSGLLALQGIAGDTLLHCAPDWLPFAHDCQHQASHVLLVHVSMPTVHFALLQPRQHSSLRLLPISCASPAMRHASLDAGTRAGMLRAQKHADCCSCMQACLRLRGLRQQSRRPAVQDRKGPACASTMSPNGALAPCMRLWSCSTRCVCLHWHGNTSGAGAQSQ